MADSDEENEKDFEAGINMTGFLFGNIDENGQLEDGILDDDAKQHLASLSISRLGLSALLQEIIDESEEKKENGDANGESKDAQESSVDEDKDDVDYQAKSPTAEDFSDINELAEDVNEESGTLITDEQECWVVWSKFIMNVS